MAASKPSLRVLVKADSNSKRYTLERETQTQVSEFEDRVVHINRCAKVVKGGRRFSFSALVVVGNKKGKIGVGLGKAKEVSEAIRKGTEAAQHSLIDVVVLDGTIPHDIEVKFGATHMLLMPAAPGTGVIAGSAARAVLELAGVRNILTKIHGSSNPNTVVHACIEGLTSQKNQKDCAALRGMNA
jgi:small subunit ribosomal protein S5